MRPGRLFVYGTLQRSAEHPLGDVLRTHATYIGDGSIRARLYWINDPVEPDANFFPGAVPSARSEDRVHGELYEVHAPDVLYPILDDFEATGEGHPEPYEFLLRPVDVVMATGDIVSAASYLYTWDISDAVRISSGRFEEKAPNVR